MNTFFVFITVLLVSVMVSSSPVDYRPDIVSPIEYNGKRPQPPAPVVDGRPDVKGYPHQEQLHLPVRKGEYICGNKVCKLTPGVVPKGCNGICQYPIL